MLPRSRHRLANALIAAAFLCITETASPATHIIERGETIESIAKKYGVSEADIISLNPDAASFVFIGMELVIPDKPSAPSTTHNNASKITSGKSSANTQEATAGNSAETIIRKESSNKAYYQPKEFDYRHRNNMTLCLALELGVGYSTFNWNDGSVAGTASYSADIAGQLYFEEQTSFIPANWYAELSLGYDRRGASDFALNYIHANILPVGYRIQFDNSSLLFKAGVRASYPLGDLKTSQKSWASDFQIGITGGIQFDWHRFSIGVCGLYDFTQVSSSASEKLNNIAVLGTISYKLAIFGN